MAYKNKSFGKIQRFKEKDVQQSVLYYDTFILFYEYFRTEQAQNYKCIIY